MLVLASLLELPAQIPTTGLVANYEFSGSALDAGPYALHGTVNALGFGLCGVLAWRAKRGRVG